MISDTDIGLFLGDPAVQLLLLHSKHLGPYRVVYSSQRGTLAAVTTLNKEPFSQHVGYEGGSQYPALKCQ